MTTKIIDTNIFARYLVSDNTPQFEKSKQIFTQIEKGKLIGLVSILVLDELIWVLESYYDIPRSVFIPKLLQLFSLKGIKTIEWKKSAIVSCLQKMITQNLDFTDLYLMEVAQGKEILSFDKALVKSS